MEKRKLSRWLASTSGMARRISWRIVRIKGVMDSVLRQASGPACGQCCTSFGGAVGRSGWLELVDSKDRAWRPCFTRHHGVSGHTSPSRRVGVAQTAWWWMYFRLRSWRTPCRISSCGWGRAAAIGGSGTSARRSLTHYHKTPFILAIARGTN